jgi:cytoskeletal protein CcmA (bactofilin family)
MKRSRIIISALLMGALLMFPVASGASMDAGESVYRQGLVDDDYYAAGGEVNLDATINGDATVAGGELSISGRISDDLMAAGGKINIRGSVEDDLRIAGGEIYIDATIGDDMMVTGGKINIAPATTIGGNARLAGGEMTVAGTIAQDLTAAGADLKLAGTVNGNVEFKGEHLSILDGAHIAGDLNYQSPIEAVISPGAVITGKTNYEVADWEQGSQGFGFFFVITMIIAGIAFFLLFPNFSVESAQRIRSDPLKSIGVGFILFLITPFVAIVLMSIVVGIWVGMALLALYAVALLAGYLIGCLFVGDWGARLMKQELTTKGRRIASLALAIVLLGIVALVPALGGLLIFILLLSGLGAGLLQIQLAYNRLPD